MKLRNQYSISRFIVQGILILCVCLTISGCVKKSARAHNKYESKGNGSISYRDNDFEMKLENIFSCKGEKIDYLSGVDIKGDITVTVDSSGVDTTVPGKYLAIYTASKGEISESEQVEVIIEEKESTTDADEMAEAYNFKSDEVISDGVTYPEKNAGTAKITLSNGIVAEIDCTTKRYIVSTRTDNYNEKKGKHMYNISRLVITFNTGEERVLETIQKKID